MADELLSQAAQTENMAERSRLIELAVRLRFAEETEVAETGRRSEDRAPRPGAQLANR